MEETFKERLKEELNNFDLEKAEALSMEIHEAESEGYEISEIEDNRWIKLTDQIFGCYNRKEN